MIKPFVAAAFAVASVLCVTAPATAQTGGAVVGTAPGKAAIAQTVKVSATITDIDKATRDVTLKGPQGNLMTVTAGPDVKNFDKLKVGDQVDLQYVEALTLELKKGGGMAVAAPRRRTRSAPRRARCRAVQWAARSSSLPTSSQWNPANQIVTLKGPNQTVDLRIADQEQFKRIAKGDQVEAKFTQALAVAVEPATNK